MTTRFRTRTRPLGLLLAAALALVAAAVPTTPAAAASATRTLLVGQNNVGAWNDLTGATGASPSGGSVYYSVRNDAFTGTCEGGGTCDSYLQFLGQRGSAIEVGVDWKDNPPGWDGQSGDIETASQQATEAIAQGRYDQQFSALVNTIKQYPSSTFYLRLDYEVSTAFDCLNGTDCSSYVNAFQHLVTLIRNESGAGSRVQFVYHPVRGEFDALYPGDQWVDWIGLSVFNQDLCQPYWENGTTYWNGQENTSDRTCLGYYDAYVNGNLNAIPYEYPVDLNILRMMWFAQQHGKPMMIAESGVQRMSSTLNANGTQNDSDYAAWMNRFSTLLNYVGPLPNGTVSGQQTNFIGTGYNLSGVVKMVTYIDIDWRYGFDGQTSPTQGFGESSTSGWFVNSLLSDYSQGTNAFCSVLANDNFTTRCT